MNMTTEGSDAAVLAQEQAQVKITEMPTIAEADDQDVLEQEQEQEPEPLWKEAALSKGLPVSDLDVAATYAELEMRSVASQFAATVVDVTKPRPTAALALEEADHGTAKPGRKASGSASGNETETEEEEDETIAALHGLSSSDEEEDADSSDDEDEDERQSQRKLRAEIEAAMEREANAPAVLKTANEVSDVPVRTPAVEVTPASRIARCGTILSMNEKSLMATVTSDSGENPLDEGSVLCLADRTVLGCVDEVFGPVLMPMYLVRFEAAEKIPALATIGQDVFYVTEATTYLVPDQLRSKGTDASNLYDEETDEAVYSDDEAESAAKHQHRKRNRVDSAPAQLQMVPEGRSRSSSGGFFVEAYQPQPMGRQRTGSGAWRGQIPHNNHHNRGHRGGGGYHNNFFQPIQAQPQGGITRYTSPGFVPGAMNNYSPAPPMPPAAYGGFGPSYMAGAPTPQYGFPQYGVPFEPQQRAQFTPSPFYAPPLPPNAANAAPPNGFFDPNSPQYDQQFPPPQPSSFNYGRN